MGEHTFGEAVKAGVCPDFWIDFVQPGIKERGKKISGAEAWSMLENTL